MLQHKRFWTLPCTKSPRRYIRACVPAADCICNELQDCFIWMYVQRSAGSADGDHETDDLGCIYRSCLSRYRFSLDPYPLGGKSRRPNNARKSAVSQGHPQSPKTLSNSYNISHSAGSKESVSRHADRNSRLVCGHPYETNTSFVSCSLGYRCWTSSRYVHIYMCRDMNLTRRAMSTEPRVAFFGCTG